jgi:GntR family transcriptional regulator / MocR family aminotransferase
MKQHPYAVQLLIERRFDPGADSPRYRQLYELLRQMVVDRELTAGTRLPSTRAMAAALGLSRHTVSTAVERLLAEGYLISRPGSGTYVSRHFASSKHDERPPGPARSADSLSRRAAAVISAPRSPFPFASGARTDSGAFRLGIPAVDQFPVGHWLRALNAAWKEAAKTGLGYQHPLGYPPLRQAIAHYLRASRGLNCQSEQVIVTAGSQQALELTFRLVIDPGAAVALEDPGYLGARAAALSAGARTIAIPVDREGLDVAALRALQDPPSAVFVTPTHQFPLGATMSLPRRIALVGWAEQNRAWILEDDYDSEYRYDGRPFDPLAVLDRAGRVIYIGTFSKVLFPALRLGYLVVPPSLVDAFEAAHLSSDIHRPLIEQMALARFIDQGHFAAHLRRSKEVHAERRQALLDHSARSLGGYLDIQPASAGLHLFGLLAAGTDDRAVAAAAARRGVDVWALSPHSLRDQRAGLLLGYGGVLPAAIPHGVAQLGRAIEDARPAPAPTR